MAYQGYTGNNKDYTNNRKSFVDAYSTYLKKKSADDAAQALQDAQIKAQQEINKAAGKNADGTDKSIVDKAVDLGKGIVGGVQQAGGLLTDVAIQGGGLLGDIPNPFADKKTNDKNRAKNAASSDALRQGLHNMTDVNGNPLSGTSSVDENAARINQGKGTAQDFAAVAGKSLETGVDATMFVNPASLAVKTAAGAGTKEVVKGVLKSSGLFGGTSGTAAGLQDYGKTGDVGSAIKTGLETGATTAAGNLVLGGAGVVAGKVIGKIKGGNTPPDAVAPTETKPQLQLGPGYRDLASIQNDIKALQDGTDPSVLDVKTASGKSFTTEDIAAATQKQTDSLNQQKDILNSKLAAQDSGTPMYEQTVKQIDAIDQQIKDINANGITPTGEPAVSTTVNAAKAREKFKQLQDEAAAVKLYNDNLTHAGISDVAPTRPAGDIQAEADALKSGKVPADYYSPPAMATNAHDVTMHPQLPEPLKQAGNVIATDKAYAEHQLSQLMTPEAHDAALKQLDKEYIAQVNALKDIPEARQALEKQSLTDEYLTEVNKVKDLLNQDAPQVQQLQQVLDAVKTKEASLVSDVNGFMADNYNTFKQVDQAKVDARLQELQTEHTAATDTPQLTPQLTEAADKGNFVEVATSTPENIAAVRDTVANQSFDKYHESSPVVQALNHLMSPSKVFEAMGLRDLHTKIFQASARMINANNKDTAVIREFAKYINGNKQLAKEVIDYLQGDATAIRSADPQIGVNIKAFLDEKGATLRSMGYATREDYFPHIFDKNDKVVQRVFGDKATGTIKFGNLKQRTSDSQDFSHDVIAVLSKYSQGFNKKVYLEPALKPLDELKTRVEITNQEAKFVNDYLNQLQNKNRSALEESFNGLIDSLYGKSARLQGHVGNNHFRRALGAQRMLSAVSTMGMNVSTVIRNLSQMTNTAAELNPKWSTIGMTEAIRTLPNKDSPLFKELKESGIFEGGVSKNYNIDATDTPLIGGLAEKAKTGVDLMMAGIRGSDILLRSQAYLGARAKFLSRNPGNIEGAQKAGIEATINTQFVTSNIDNALALNSPMVRSLTQLATFSIKQAEFLINMGVDVIKKTDGSYGFANVAAAGKALTFVMGAGASIAVLGPVIGMQPKEFIPFYDQFASGSIYRAPLVSLLFGDGKSKQGLTSTIAQSVDPTQRPSADTTTGDVWDKFWSDNWTSVVPAGSQIKKTTQGFQSTESGQSTNDSGKVRFLQNQDDGSKLQALLFGQYATQNGQKWLNDGMPTLSDKQTAQLKGLSPEKQKQYYDYYTAAKKVTGRDTAITAIKDAASAGNTNQATRLAAEYNQKVTEALAGYWKDNTDLPLRLRDEMTSSLYIDVQNTLDSLNSTPSTNTVQKENKYLQNDLGK